MVGGGTEVPAASSPILTRILDDLQDKGDCDKNVNDEDNNNGNDNGDGDGNNDDDDGDDG